MQSGYAALRFFCGKTSQVRTISLVEGVRQMYLALYRKYRPRTFDDVISQEHITTTLRNQVSSGSTGHAYLFTGSRGTGKTTCARILAMAMNCEHPVNGNPCLECESCKAISEGYSPDVIEMDAASNNGVDDARQLREEVNYAPINCKYKVYIIDEVHMLSPQAFNALLKVIEEPPPHIKFILATTELHKVLSTIVSRCQRFEFRRINPEDSAKRLMYVAQQENVKLDETAALLISKLSDGGMRDALSILDRCVAGSDEITPEVVRECTGAADSSHLYAFSAMVAQNDSAGCIKLLTNLCSGSGDVGIIMGELMEHYRDLMLYKTAPGNPELLSVLPDEIPKLAENAEMYTLEDILRCLTLLQQCADNIAKVKQRRIAAEMCLVKMCTGAEPASTGGRALTKQTSMKVVEIPEEKFTPTPMDKMSRESRINIDRIRAVTEETAKTIAGASPKPAAQEKPADTHTVEIPPEPPIFREEQIPPPFPEENPLPPEDFSDVPNTAEPPKEEEPATPAVSAEENSAAPNIPAAGAHSITQEEWEKAVSSMNPVMSSMFEKSTAEFESDGILTIHSPKPGVADNLSSSESNLLSCEKEISGALGYDVHIRVERAAEMIVPEGTVTAVDRLLEKARQLNIEVKQVS